MSKPDDLLPRGRHKLSREHVRGTQRRRILIAMIQAVAERGYVETTVAQVLARAGISRETFYEQFANKQECFLAAYEEAVAQTRAHLLAASDALPGESPLNRLRQVVATYLAAMEGEPEAARTFLLEVYAAGPEALKRRSDTLEMFGELVYTILVEDETFQSYTEPHFLAHALAGAISAQVASKLARGEGDRLHELEGPILTLIDDLLRKPPRV